MHACTRASGARARGRARRYRKRAHNMGLPDDRPSARTKTATRSHIQRQIAAHAPAQPTRYDSSPRPERRSATRDKCTICAVAPALGPLRQSASPCGSTTVRKEPGSGSSAPRLPGARTRGRPDGGRAEQQHKGLRGSVKEVKRCQYKRATENGRRDWCGGHADSSTLPWLRGQAAALWAASRRLAPTAAAAAEVALPCLKSRHPPTHLSAWSHAPVFVVGHAQNQAFRKQTHRGRRNHVVPPLAAMRAIPARNHYGADRGSGLERARPSDGSPTKLKGPWPNQRRSL